MTAIVSGNSTDSGWVSNQFYGRNKARIQTGEQVSARAKTNSVFRVREYKAGRHSLECYSAWKKKSGDICRINAQGDTEI